MGEHGVFFFFLFFLYFFCSLVSGWSFSDWGPWEIGEGGGIGFGADRVWVVDCVMADGECDGW